MDPRARPFPVGTVGRMEVMLERELPRHLRERTQCVRLLAMGRSTRDVAEVLGRGVSTVERHKRRFLAEGEPYLTEYKLGGRRNEVLTVQQEAEVMAGLRAAAGEGQVVTADQVRRAIEARAGRRVGTKTVYRVMHRNGWRKVAPRPTHPDGDPERRAAFQQTSQD